MAVQEFSGKKQINMIIYIVPSVFLVLKWAHRQQQEEFPVRSSFYSGCRERTGMGQKREGRKGVGDIGLYEQK